MPAKDSKDKRDRNASPNSKLKVKRTRRRIYETVPNGSPPAGFPQEEYDRKREDALQRKIRQIIAKHIVKNYMIGAMGAGLVPVPVLDMAAVSGVQLKMLHSLSNHYGIPFLENRAKAFITALIGGIGSGTLAVGTFGMLIKALPGIGTLLGSVKMSLLSGASAYAAGMVFIQHFESGGTFLNFDPEKVRNHYAQTFHKGKAATSELSDRAPG